MTVKGKKEKEKTKEEKNPLIMFSLVIFIFLLTVCMSYALGINLESPVDDDKLNYNDVVFNYNISDFTENLTCKLYIDNNYKGNSTITNNSIYNFSEHLDDGNYSWYVSCNNGTNTSDSAIWNFSLDTHAPEITDSGPSGINYNKAVTLSLETDEISTCRYDADDNDYDDMYYIFEDTDSTEHSQDLSLGEGTYHYYVRCNDEYGNKMDSSEIISFEIDLEVTADITIEDDEDDDPPEIDNTPVLKEGTYKIEVITSEALDKAPDLHYTFHDESKQRDIALVGGNTKWEGYMIIEDSTPNKIGQFHFREYGSSEDNEIESGELFLVDTIEPDAPESFEVMSQNNGDIIMEWHHDGDDVDYYNIYRKTGSGVNYVDYYDKTEKTHFTDDDVTVGMEYYYRVSAVDKAGNEGELSKSGNAMALVTDYKESTKNQLSDKSIYKINEKIKELESDVMDVDNNINELNEISNNEKSIVIKHMDLITRAKGAKNNIDSLIKELENLKKEYKTDEEINKILEKSDERLKSYKEDVVHDIEIYDKITYTQLPIGTTEVKANVNEYLIDKDMTANEIEAFLEDSVKLQDNLEVEAELITARISFYGAVTREYSIVRKTVLYKEGMENAVIIESIPKEISSKATEIEFSEQPDVLKNDPVVSWEFNNLTSYEYIYSVEGLKEPVLLQDTKTIISAKFIKYSGDMITGQATGNAAARLKGLFSVDIILITFGIILIIGLVSYYFFFLEDKAETGQDDKNEPDFFTKLKEKISSGKNPIISPEDRKEYDKRHFDEVASLMLNQMAPMLKEANRHANNLDYDNALDIYKYLNNLYSGHDFPMEMGEMVEKELDYIYNKLSVIHNINKAHNYVDNKDWGKLKGNLKKIRESYQRIKPLIKDTKLEDNLKKSHDYFSFVLSSYDYNINN